MYGHEIGAPPDALDGTTVLARLVDGLAFRYYWATEGLRPEDFTFRPGPDSMSTLELLKHILYLTFMIEQTVRNADAREKLRSEDPGELREKTLETLAGIRSRLGRLTDETLATHEVLRRDGSRYPVWNIINGPLADALTHVGQINAWRRLNGNPTRAADVFAGLPPREA